MEYGDGWIGGKILLRLIVVSESLLPFHLQRVNSLIGKKSDFRREDTLGGAVTE